MFDYDGEKRFLELAHYHMDKCEYRKNTDGIGICSLHILPCEKVLYKGNCEAVAKWVQTEREGE